MKLTLGHSYILHTRPFKETSLIAEFFSKEAGKVSVLIRGAKRKSFKHKGLVQPFVPLWVEAVGRHELRTATQVEQMGTAQYFQGKPLLSAMYLNELLFKLLPKEDAYIDLFEKYEQTLTLLHGACLQHQGWHLRAFEYTLLKALGYGFDVYHDIHQNPIDIELCYEYDAQGLKPARAGAPHLISGKTVVQFRNGDCQANPLELKSLFRTMIHGLLDGKILYTRELARTKIS